MKGWSWLLGQTNSKVWLVIGVLLGVGLEFFATFFFYAFYVTLLVLMVWGGQAISTSDLVIAFLIWLPLQLGIVLGFSFTAKAIALGTQKRLAFRIVLAAGIALTTIIGLVFLGVRPPAPLEELMGRLLSWIFRIL